MKPVLFALLFSFRPSPLEVVQWENIPLPVTLHVGQERIVDVGKAVRIGYPATLEGKVRLQSAGGKGISAGEYGVPGHPNPAT